MDKLGLQNFRREWKNKTANWGHELKDKTTKLNSARCDKRYSIRNS